MLSLSQGLPNSPPSRNHTQSNLGFNEDASSIRHDVHVFHVRSSMAGGARRAWALVERGRSPRFRFEAIRAVPTRVDRGVQHDSLAGEGGRGLHPTSTYDPADPPPRGGRNPDVHRRSVLSSVQSPHPQAHARRLDKERCTSTLFFE